MVITKRWGGTWILLPPVPSTSVKSLEKFYEGLFAVRLIENAPIENEGMTMIFADAHSLIPEDPSEKFWWAMNGALPYKTCTLIPQRILSVLTSAVCFLIISAKPSSLILLQVPVCCFIISHLLVLRFLICAFSTERQLIARLQTWHV